MASDEIDAKQVLEQIRAANYDGFVSAGLLDAVYGIEHDKQFETERGPVVAQLRDLISRAIEESA